MGTRGVNRIPPFESTARVGMSALEREDRAVGRCRNYAN